MLRSILVPLDGSAFSEQALPIAVALARRTRASLRLIQVHVPAALGAGAGALPLSVRHEQAQRRDEAEHLDRVARRITREAEIQVGRVLLDGPVVETIDRYAQNVGADLVVMTTHGRSGVGRAWLGSAADGLVRRTHRPILLIRAERSAPERYREARFRRVLIPLDGSADSERVIPHALAVAEPDGAEILLLRVVPPMPPYGSWDVPYALYAGPVDVEQRVASADAYLEGIAASLARDRVAVATHVMVHAQPAVAVLEVAERTGVDLVALATHGRGGVVRLVVGSVADRVLHGTAAPLLLLRPDSR